MWTWDHFTIPCISSNVYQQMQEDMFFAFRFIRLLAQVGIGSAVDWSALFIFFLLVRPTDFSVVHPASDKPSVERPPCSSRCFSR